MKIKYFEISGRFDLPVRQAIAINKELNKKFNCEKRLRFYYGEKHNSSAGKMGMKNGFIDININWLFSYDSDKERSKRLKEEILLHYRDF